MRLSDVLSSNQHIDFKQVDGFLGNKRLSTGKTKNISVGNICLNFFCKNCNELRTFQCNTKIQCIGIKDNLISIDCVLQCPSCKETVPVWFLIESEQDMHSLAPNVRILKYSCKLSDNVLANTEVLSYSDLLDKADMAYREGLGAASIIYLRKIYEIIVSKIVKKYNIDKKLSFEKKLQEANKKECFIPKGIDDRKYNLFQELSNCIHSDFDDDKALGKYPALKELIQAIIKNIQTNDRLKTLRKELNW